MEWVAGVLTGLYAFLLIYYARGWQKMGDARSDYCPDLTVLIPARNESLYLPALLHDIQQQEYDGKIEVIVIDDHSTDDTVSIAKQMGASVVRLADHAQPKHQAFKKHGITLGVTQAKHSWIVMTDADSRAGSWWLRSLLQVGVGHTQLIAGPVVMNNKRGFLGAFQAWDMLGMQLFTGGGITLGHPMLVSGANLAFTKKAFEQVQGYTGTTNKASGDDIFLMQKISSVFGAEAIRYACDKKAVVSTWPVEGWKDLWQQRIRWASKTAEMTKAATAVLMYTAYLFHLSILLMLIVGLWQPTIWIFALAFFIVKCLTEALVLRSLVKRWQLQVPWLWLVFSQMLYVPYVVVVGFLGNFISYQWKGRKLK